LFFLYQENLDILRAAGAELVFFSPLADTALPEGGCGLYLCGGYPELYARELSANQSMLQSIRAFIHRGGPVYAEGGGYMYLMSELKDAAGETWPLVGHFPWACYMQTHRQALGYRKLSTLVPSCLGPAGTQARGHVFHYSTADEPDFSSDSSVDAMTEAARLFKAENAVARPEAPLGVRFGSVTASYVHVHFAFNPKLACNFISDCVHFGTAYGLV
jgi:cobyrinic acid a,c-diamide synthase